MKKIITASVIGMGHRGVAYADQMYKLKDEFKIVSICDKDYFRAHHRAEPYQVSPEMIFTDDKKFFEEKRSDLLVISTQDRDHVGHAIKALELGYDILLEKPISPIKDELYRLLEAQKKYQRKILVCHVLRYAPAFEKLKEIVDSGVLGKIIMIDDVENVQYQHQSHSFVRGNWRNDNETSPMIMAKCCHDLDLITWFASSKCETVSSFGQLSFFKEENQPKGASDRCLSCQFVETCPYSAKKIYIDDHFWGRNMITDADPNTDEAVYEALEKGPYGRCVFKCDNNVVDNQAVIMKFQNGIVANLRMTAFMDRSGRDFTIYGTHGCLYLREDDDLITLKIFGTHEVKNWKVSDLADVHSSAHNGADQRMIEELYGILIGKDPVKTSLDVSVESHLIALASEESRLNNGEAIIVKH